MAESQRLITIIALARELRLPAAWLKMEAKEGRLPCLRVGRHIRFNREAVEQFLYERAGISLLLPAQPFGGAPGQFVQFMGEPAQTVNAAVLRLTDLIRKALDAAERLQRKTRVASNN